MDAGEHSLSEEISRLAEKYDPVRDGEAHSIRALLQGAMAMQVGLNRPTPPIKDLIDIRSVEQEKDEYGDYRPYFTIVTGAGHRIRVTLSVEQP